MFFDSNIQSTMRAGLTGVTFGDRQKNIQTYCNPENPTFGLFREPDNPHDPNAISVGISADISIGYIPTKIAQHLAPMMDSGRHFIAKFVQVNKSPYHSVVGITVDIVETTRQ